MEQVQLSVLANVLGSTAPVEASITEICTDTRTLQPGCLFLALKGASFDGHDFVERAIAAGAVAAVTERQIADCPCLVVADTGRALLQIAAWYRSQFHPILVGVTGSVGKTTTKEMIALVLAAKYHTLKTAGNLNNEIGLPKTLLQLTADHTAAVIEMGMSHFGEISRLSQTAQPTIGVITNIGYSHIENLKTQEGILKAKMEILDGMAEDAPLIVNGDDPLLRPLKQGLTRPSESGCGCLGNGYRRAGWYDHLLAAQQAAGNLCCDTALYRGTQCNECYGCLLCRPLCRPFAAADL